METLSGESVCTEFANKFAYYATIVTALLTLICILIFDIAVVITGYNVYKSNQRRFQLIYMCGLIGMISANLYLILYFFSAVIPFWIEEIFMTNYMFWFYLT